MPQGRCVGCDHEATVSAVLKHQRGCAPFAEVYRFDPERALTDPAVVYAEAHPPLDADPKPAAAPKSVADRKPRARRTVEPATTASRPAGSVHVEYWSWQPTMLEDMQGV